jgi:hypothetical protein
VSEMQTTILDSGRDDLVFLDLLIEWAAQNPQPPGCSLNAALLFLQDSLDVAPLQFLEA